MKKISKLEFNEPEIPSAKDKMFIITALNTKIQFPFTSINANKFNNNNRL